MRKKTVLAAKLEATLGTAESLAAADAAFNVYDLEIEPEAEEQERSSQGSASRLSTTIGARQVKFTFKIEMMGSGVASTDPDWAPVFLPALGMVGNTNVYTVKTKVPVAASDNNRTITIGGYHDGRLVTAAGCMGTAKFVFENGKVAYMDCEFMGKYVSTTDATLLAPTLPTVLPPRASNLTFTYGGASPGKTERIEIDLQNEVTLRQDLSVAAGESGYCYATIVDRNPKAVMSLEAQLVATFDVYGKWLAQSEEAFVLDIGGATWNKMEFDAPKAQILKPNLGDRDGMITDELEMQFNRSAAVDDEFSLTFAAS
jgi:hypothetical protein